MLDDPKPLPRISALKIDDMLPSIDAIPDLMPDATSIEAMRLSIFHPGGKQRR